jgi:5,5'-dehydrodivanillate O-demethylase
MLTEQENDRLSRVERDTPMGNLMRRYWQPIATVEELEREQVMPVRRLGENLVLFRSEAGVYGLVQERCPHRSASLAYGIPHEDGIRCPYHGWLYSPDGRCLDQPFEETENPGSSFKDKIRVDSYPVEALGGLIWAYFGPEPRPLLPRWDLLVMEDVNRTIQLTYLPCNWLQCMENSLDPVHFEWLHANLINYVAKKRGQTPVMFPAHHKKIAFDVFEYGIYKRRLLDDQDPETSEDWLVGHPILFPNTLQQGTSFQFRVPVDDYNTLHILYTTKPCPDGDEPKTEVSDLPYKHEDGRLVLETILGTDMMAWITQGPIAPRNYEHLGVSDRGVILYRQMLSDAIDAIERGEEPPCLVRDEAVNYPMIPLKREAATLTSFNLEERDRSRGLLVEVSARAVQ